MNFYSVLLCCLRSIAIFIGNNNRSINANADVKMQVKRKKHQISKNVISACL